MEFKGNQILVDRALSELDLFAIGFVDVLAKHTGYVIISGYVSILLGRARVSEDIDIIIPKMAEKAFQKLHQALADNGFYCLNSSSPYSYISTKIPVRYAKKGMVIPNIELKFATTPIESTALSTKLAVKLGKRILYISRLELQIAFKESVLKSPKDLEDAKHLREVARGHLNLREIDEYKRQLR